ncbi:hypothetical protein [Amorphus sp. MBR-141]
MVEFRESVLWDFDIWTFGAIIDRLVDECAISVRRRGRRSRVFAPDRSPRRGRPNVGSTGLGSPVDKACLALLRDVVEEMVRLQVAETDRSISRVARADERRIVAAEVVDACRRRSAGTTLPNLRRALWLAFPSAMPRLADVEPVLSIESEAADLPAQARRPRLPNGLPLSDRLAGLLERAGDVGMTASELSRATPKSPSADVRATLDALVSMGRIQHRRCRVSRRARQGDRYWSADVVVPFVSTDGMIAR